MAKKETPKAAYSLKQDFYTSIDNALQQAVNLMQSVDQAIELGAISNDGVRSVLKERSATMRAALYSDD